MMKMISPTQTKCVHVLAGRTDVITGLPSTMRRVKDYDTRFTERCEVCSKEITHKRSDQYTKIKRNDAEGKRLDDLAPRWRDVMQPTNPDGTENKEFTRLYGWNPSAADPAKRSKNPPWLKTEKTNEEVVDN